MPPDITCKRVTKLELEQRFDSPEFQQQLKSKSPETYRITTPKSLGFPSGTITNVHEYKDDKNGRLALTCQYRNPQNGTNCGGRDEHPTGLMVDGEWWY